METLSASMLRHLPLAVLVTAIVVLVPSIAVTILRATGTMTSLVTLIPLAVALSLVLTSTGSTLWSRRRRPDDLLFCELLLWGWYRRWRTERKLRNGEAMLRDLEEGRQRGRTESLAALSAVAEVFEAQDRYLDGHSRRVACYAALVARHMGLSREEVGLVRAAAAVHDVGKLRIPTEILDKPAALTEEEFELIKRHPDEGAALVAPLRDPGLTSIVRHHHERLDGTGYPSGLTGEEIPLGARIVAVADTFDAITSARPYRPPAPHQRAIQILRREAGTQLDPEAVEVFIRCYAGRRSVLLWTALTSVVQGAFAASSRAAASLRAGMAGLGSAGTSTAAGIAGVAAAGMCVLVAAQAAPAARNGAPADPSSVTLAAIAATPVTLAEASSTSPVEATEQLPAPAGSADTAGSSGGWRAGARPAGGGAQGLKGGRARADGGPGAAPGPARRARPHRASPSPGSSGSGAARPEGPAPSSAGSSGTHEPAGAAPPAAAPSPTYVSMPVGAPAPMPTPSPAARPAPSAPPDRPPRAPSLRKRRGSGPAENRHPLHPAPASPRPPRPPAATPVPAPPQPPRNPGRGEGSAHGDSGLHRGATQGRGNAYRAPGNVKAH